MTDQFIVTRLDLVGDRGYVSESFATREEADAFAAQLTTDEQPVISQPVVS